MICAFTVTPKAWPTGSVKGLRARGGFIVDIEWEGGKLSKTTITSRHGSPFRLRSGDVTSAPEIPACSSKTIDFP